MPNCNEEEKGCKRCEDRYWEKRGEHEKMSDPEHVAGSALDRCLCVHAEQNALLTAARFGIAVQGATIYTTLSPCFTCLKEAVQAGIGRVVFEMKYEANYSPSIAGQYELMIDQLRSLGGEFAYEPLGGVTPATTSQPQPGGD
jgi:deoxycytidylate deaminase